MQRRVHEQIEHEQVVMARVKQLELLYRVLADPDIIRSDHTKGLYPDIIVMDEGNNVLFVEHVETERSVTKKKRNEQWARYSRLNFPFNLIVPSTELLKARYLINGLKIHRLYFYRSTLFDIRFYQVYNFDVEIKRPKYLQDKNLKLT
jgi:hypothetical protein